MTRPNIPTCVAFAALLVLSAILISAQMTSGGAASAGLLLIWIAAIPGILYLQGIDRPPIPFAPMIGIFYIVFFGLPVFLEPLGYISEGKLVLYRRVLLEPITAATVLLAAAGVASLFVALYFSKRILFARLPRFRLPAAPDRASLNILYGLLLIGSLAYHHVPAVSSIPSIGQFLAPAGYLALGGFYLQWRSGCLAWWQIALVFFVAMPLDLVWRVQTLSLSEILWLVLFFAFVFWRERRFRTLAALAFSGMIVALTYSATTMARYDAPTLDGKFESIGAYVERVITNSSARAVLSGDPPAIEYNPFITPVVSRIAQIWIFQAVHERTPDKVPYWKGETYRPLATSFIPRILYPAKPEERAGLAFGLRYGFETDPQGPTSYNLPWITELLANFGAIGVIVGMAAFGLLLGLLDGVFNRDGASDVEFLIGLAIIYRLCNQESNFSLVIGSIILLLVVLFAYFVLGSALLERLRSTLHSRTY